jgi:putative hemolysin
MSILYLFISLLFISFFSGIEIAYVSANRLLVELRKKKQGFVGSILTRFYENPSQFISSVLVGHNIALVIFTLLLTNMLTPFISNGITDTFWQSIVVTIITTVVVLFFGEYIPKAIFRLFADSIMVSFAIPTRILQTILGPPTWLLTKASTFLLNLFSKEHLQNEDNVFTRHDLQHFLNSKNISQDEVDTDLFTNALKLNDIKVKQCMIPRNEIIHLDIADPIDELRKLFIDSNMSRIFIVQGDTDNILGYIHHQQMLKKITSIKSNIMPVEFVPEVMKATELMNKMIKEKSSIACVVDEYGSTSGIITLEDILELIFGDIEDEHDKEDYIEFLVSENEYLFSGRLDIEYLNSKYDLEIPVGDYHTIAGYITETQNSIPEQGTIIEQDNFLLVVELVSETKVETVRIKKLGNGGEQSHK